MACDLLVQLKSRLAQSMSEQRKHWAHEIIDRQVSLQSLFSLWHADSKTAQRFMWLMGDISELDPDRVVPCMPFLFALRDQMPFPGMHRSVAKWLLNTNVPEEVAPEATEQLFAWLKDEAEEIGCKHYATKALLDLSRQNRFSLTRLKHALRTESNHQNRAYRGRVQRLLNKLECRS
jgi:hypothetical protein